MADKTYCRQTLRLILRASSNATEICQLGRAVFGPAVVVVFRIADPKIEACRSDEANRAHCHYAGGPALFNNRGNSLAVRANAPDDS